MIKLKKCLIKIIPIILLVVYGMCVIRINRKYPQTKVEIVGLDQCIQYQGVDVLITDNYVMNETDINQYFSWEKEHYGGCIGIVADVLIENNSSTEKKVDLTALIFESGGWKNAIHYMAFTKLNEGNEKMSFNPILQPGENIQLKLPTFAAPIHMRESQWDAFLERDIYLTFSLYPEKLMALLISEK